MYLTVKGHLAQNLTFLSNLSKIKGRAPENRLRQCTGLLPPKFDFNRRSQSKLMVDAQKAFSIPNVGEASDRVHIPDTLEDSDSDVIFWQKGLTAYQ
jgi:hypothetical protein